MNHYKPLLLIVLDGWGYSTQKENNAVALAHTPTWDALIKDYPWTLLDASAEAVGLPSKTIGNSEVGHMNIGAGRIVYQDLTRINTAIQDKSFFKNPVLKNLAATVKKSGGALHLMGLLSDGGVHSHLSHLFALLDFAKSEKIEKVFLHCFMDGRDTPPHAGENYLKKLEEKIATVGNAAVATVIGRYYAMDRDKRWERTALAYEALVEGKGEKATSALEAIRKSYANKTTDEFVLPTVLEKNGQPVGLIQDGDAVLFFNYRADRARQLITALQKGPKLAATVTMTRYEKSYPYPVVFAPQNLDNVFGEVLSKKGLKQCRIAETEKYAHVTYFFNGGQEIAFAGEERCLVPSPKEVATYDLKPEMSAAEVTREILERLDSKNFDCMIINYANPDMVGHSGRLDAAIKAVETVDKCLGEVLCKLAGAGGSALVTADHGNAECMADEKGLPHTAHTLNKVPLVLVTPEKKQFKLKSDGKLCDIAPTMLELLDIQKPAEMTGTSLVILAPYRGTGQAPTGIQ